MLLINTSQKYPCEIKQKNFLHSNVNLVSGVDKASSYEKFVSIYLTYAYTTYASVTIGLRWANSLLFEVKLISEKKKLL